MTYEEVKKMVSECGLNITSEFHEECMEKVLSALEKQIPKEHHHTRVIAVNADIRESICPSCLGVIATNKKEYPKYCTWCGQAIDWSE